MRYAHFILVLAVILCAATTSCKKVLEVENFGFFTENDILKTEADAANLLLGAYSELTNANSYTLFNQVYWNIFDLDHDHTTGSSWLFGNLGSGNYMDFWGMNRMWDGPFKVVQRTNKVIIKVPAMNIDEAVKANVLGEAHALRAWAYFVLVQIYGPLPLRTTIMEDDPNVNVPRASVGDVYRLIVRDLRTAIPLLAAKGNSLAGGTGRIHKAAAQSLLAKVFLTMASGAQKGVPISVRGGKDNAVYNYTQNGVAGYEDFNSNDYFKKARDLADSVITGKGGGGAYSLISPISDVFTKAQINGSEAIWYLPFKDGSDHWNQLNMYFSACSPVRGYGGWIYLTNHFYASYEEQDHRVLKLIYHTNFFTQYDFPYASPAFYPNDKAKYGNYKAMVTLPDGTKKEQEAAYTNKASTTKYSDVSHFDSNNSDATFYLIRFSDVLLMFAEADNEINPGSAVALQRLNKVRERSKATPAPAMNQTDFRSFVMEERARELAMESNRRFDLIRRGIFLQVMNQLDIDQENNIKRRSEKHLLFPIPITELNGNKSLKQNPGW